MQIEAQFRHHKNIILSELFSQLTGLSDQVVKNQSDFIKYMKCILKHKLTGMNSFDYEKLKEDISSNKTVRRKNWLLQKLEEIHESHSNK